MVLLVVFAPYLAAVGYTDLTSDVDWPFAFAIWAERSGLRSPFLSFFLVHGLVCLFVYRASCRRYGECALSPDGLVFRNRFGVTTSVEVSDVRGHVETPFGFEIISRRRPAPWTFLSPLLLPCPDPEERSRIQGLLEASYDASRNSRGL